MTMDNDNRKKLKQFWQKRLLLGLGTMGFLGLGAGTIGLIQSTYDELQIVEGRDVPERFYQQQVAQVQTLIDRQPTMIVPQDKQQGVQGLFNSFSGQRSPCFAINALGQLKDPRAIPLLGKLLQDSQTRIQTCDGQSPSNDAIHMGVVRALGQFRREDATAYLKAALIKPPEPEILALWKEDAAHIAITQKLEVLRVLGPISQYDQHWKNAMIETLPEFNRLKKPDHAAPTLEMMVIDITRKIIDAREINPQLTSRLIPLFQDKTVKDEVLVGIIKTLSENHHNTISSCTLY
jgi:PBS lyase HEAT-like repeat